MSVVLIDREDGRLRDGDYKGLWGECGDRVDGDKGMIGYVGGRIEKMEWEDIGKYRVRGGRV